MIEAHTFCSEFVNVGCVNPLIPIAPQGIPTLLIATDPEDIRLFHDTSSHPWGFDTGTIELFVVFYV